MKRISIDLNREEVDVVWSACDAAFNAIKKAGCRTQDDMEVLALLGACAARLLLAKVKMELEDGEEDVL